MAWFRQYRPQRVADLHLTVVREQLQSVLDSGKFAQAYLFAGPKGTGKTSAARILARILNDPKNEKVVLGAKGVLQESTSDLPFLRQIAQGQSAVIIEQDAASHRGIDDIRQLQEQVSLAPGEGLVRMVILDEAHMLTTEAFNALLKLLEEPPARVVFVLATTEQHKIPATIQSRCQIIAFRRATPEELTLVLQQIAAAEKFELEEAVAARIAQAANGSFRDAVKLLEQVARSGKVDNALLDLTLGVDTAAETLLRSLAAKDAAGVSSFFQEVRSKGQSLAALESGLVLALQQRLHRAISRNESTATIAKILHLLEHLSSRLGGPEPLEGLKLELACLSWCLGAGALDSGADEPSGSSAPARPKSAALVVDEPVVVKSVQEVRQELKAAQAQPITVSQAEQSLQEAVTSDLTLSAAAAQSRWSDFLLAVRTRSQAVEAILRNAQFLGIDHGVLTLCLNLPFHREQLEMPKYARLIQEAMSQEFPGIVLRYELELSPELKGVVETSSVSQDDQLMKAVEDAVLSLG